MGFSFAVFDQNGCEKGHEGDLQGACQEPQEEGGRRRWQGQEEEVVQGKDQGQVEQLGALRQGHIRQAAQEVPTYKLITPSIVSERLKVRGSLARKALIQLEKEGKISCVVRHSSQMIYTRPHSAEDEKDE